MNWVTARGLAGSVLVVLSGYADAPLPSGSWTRHVHLLTELRSSSHHAAGIVLGLSGLLLLTWAWWDLMHRVSGAAGVRRTWRTVAVWAAPMMLAPPTFGGDGWSYVATGYLTGHGLSPYVWPAAVLPNPLRSAVSHAWWYTPSPYGPLAEAWGGVFSHLTANPWLLLLAYRLLAVIGLALLAWAVPRLAARAGRDPAWATAAVVASPLVMAHGMAALHNDLAVAGLVMAALALTRRHSWLLPAVLVGAATAIKLPGGLAVVGVVLLSLAPGAPWWARARRGALVVGVAAGTVLALGYVSGLGTGWLNALSVPGDLHSVLSITDELGRQARGQLYDLGVPGHAVARALHPVQLAKLLGVIGLAGFATWVALFRRWYDDATALIGASLVLVADTLLSPVVNYWYFLWCLPLVGCLVRHRVTRAAALSAMAALGLAGIADPALHLLWLDWTGVWVVLGLPALVTLVAWLTDPQRTRRAPAVSGRDLDRRESA